MAPELVRGGTASVASDVWALGVVIHEIVFGVKPRWSDPSGREMLPPELGRKLTEEERAALEACRACAAKEPTRQGRDRGRGRAVAHGGGGGGGGGSGGSSSWKRAVMLASSLTVVAAVAVGMLRLRQAPPDTRPPSTPDRALIVPTGEAADWTDVSSSSPRSPSGSRCTRLLPDQQTIRFVWGIAPRAEDVDTVTRSAFPRPLVPAAYAGGCPDVSPDGKRLVYQGHTPDGRPFAFVSERSDGSQAVPRSCRTAEPTMSSEPTWLADGQSFSYDSRHETHGGVLAGHESRDRVAPGDRQGLLQHLPPGGA